MVLALIFLTFCLLFELIIYGIRVRKKKKSINDDTKIMRAYQSISELFHNIQLNLPKGTFVSKGHVWFKQLSKDEVRVGLDDFCPKLITKIDRIKLHNPGDRVNNNGGMCTIYQGKKKLTFFSPLDGTIREVNPELMKNPKIICKDPFGRGWIYRLKPSLEISYLVESESVDKDILDWEQREVDRLANFIMSDSSTKTTVEENLKNEKSGLHGLLDQLDSFYWLKFEENFLR